jgi:hypothetical protein
MAPGGSFSGIGPSSDSRPHFSPRPSILGGSRADFLGHALGGPVSDHAPTTDSDPKGDGVIFEVDG